MFDEMYTAKRLDNGSWEVLNNSHPLLKDVGPDDDVPREAFTSLTEGEFIAIVKEATVLGILQNAELMNKDNLSDIQEKYDALDQENEKLEVELNEQKFLNNKLEKQISELKNIPQSESYLLKRYSIDSILKLVGMHDVKE